ncbi:uromodulin-like [Orbicella faveolata]|uniref:uromodulin-like n=1 Tax=Orbicella faveolata TaxID=48498 RepID=UPI0009E2C4CE|nr:uromodulin-like [Orbicella faveolata]
MNGSYAILIDHGAVVGQGCSYDGPPTPGITSASDWGFIVDGVCPVGFSLAPPGFTSCVDVDECASHSRSKRSLPWWWQYPISSSTAGYSGSPASASASSSHLSECSHHSYLEDSVRGMGFYNGYYGYYQCDNYLPFGWYRFRGAAGTEMPTSCVGKNRCSSHAPGWLNVIVHGLVPHNLSSLLDDLFSSVCTA